MYTYPTSSLYYSINHLLCFSVFLLLCHAIHCLFRDPVACIGRLPRSMLLDRSSTNGQQAWIGIVTQLFLCQRLVQPLVHMLQIFKFREQNCILTSNCSPYAKACQEASCLKLTQKFTDLFLQSPRRFIILLFEYIHNV